MISFDIFDTLITRKTYSPEGIFLLIQQRLFHDPDISNAYFCSNFYTLRMNAEKDARLYAEQEGREEIFFDEIYDILAYRNNISKELIDRIKEYEIQAEIDNTCPVKKNIELLKRLASEGKHIVLISDMYLSKDVIRKILLKSSSIFYNIPIYVSSEIKKTKHSGSLYLDVAKMEKEKFSSWMHFGDNRKSDYLVPRMLGIDAKHIPLEELTSWENELGNKLGLKNKVALQFYFGTIRNIRAERAMGSTMETGVSIGGMLLYPYILWLLRKSIEMDVKHLYFIARDGYILKKIADLVIINQGLNIDTSYIYGSRKTWRVNELSETDKQKVIMYLSQEIDFSDSDFAFVDLHGTGITMEYLSDIIYKRFEKKTKVFYFDLLKNKSSDLCMFIPFCSEHSGIAELFCRAPHGATLGYDQRGTKIIPKLQKIDKVYWEKAGLYDYLEGVELFAEKMSQCKWEYWMEDIGLVEAMLDYCRREPSQELCEFMGNMPHYDGIEEENVQYAPMLSVKDIFKIYMWRTIEDLSESYSGANFGLSLLRTNHKYDREKRFLEKHYASVLGKCIHRFKNRKKKYKAKVVIYGAGNIGKRLYEDLISTSGIRITGWTDMDYERYQQLGNPVVPLQEVLRIDYQYMIIAVGNPVDLGQIQNILIHLGVPKQKIVGYKDFFDKVIELA